MKKICARDGCDIEFEAVTNKKYCNEDCKKKINRIRRSKWNKNNPEKVRNYDKKWRENNPEKVREREKKWSKNNPEKVKNYKKKFRLKQKIINQHFDDIGFMMAINNKEK